MPSSSDAVNGGHVSGAEVVRRELKWIADRREAVFRERVPADELPPGSDTATPQADPRSPEEPPPDGGEGSSNDDARLVEARLDALDEHLAGLALSGGGIRSGTFAVGFLQGLASLGLLGRFDYLSTVSGGGYAGGWLAAWLRREGSLINVERQLAPSRVSQSSAKRHYLPTRSLVVDEEPEPLHHLREYSSYLAPRYGLLTADTWAVVMIWLRNVSINMMMIFPAAMLLVLLARGVVYLYGTVNRSLLDTGEFSAWYLAASLVAILAGLACLRHAFAINAEALQEFRPGGGPARRPGWEKSSGGPQLVRRVIRPVLLAALLLTCAIPPVLAVTFDALRDWTLSGASARSSLMASLLLWLGNHLGPLGFPNILAHILLFGGLMAWRAARVSRAANRFRWKYVGCAFLAGGSGGVLFAVLEAMMGAWSEARRPDLLATFAVPGALTVLMAALIVEVALLGPDVSESEREWWARLCAGFGLAATFWLVAMATVVYVPAAFLVANNVIRAALPSTWVVTTAAGVLSGRRHAARGKGSRDWLPLLARVAPAVFVVGLVGLVALLVAYLVNGSVPEPVGPCDLACKWRRYLEGLQGTSWLTLAFYGIVMYVLYEVASGLIDVNLFSLHAMYANRLVRCYLGASRPKPTWRPRWQDHRRDVLCGAPTNVELRRGNQTLERDENPVTGFDPGDDFPLSDLAAVRDGTGAPAYPGPFPLINATLNRVAGAELAWRDRKGESFLLSPLYCGTKETGYALAPTSNRARNLTFGRAMAISGAAVDPNMGYLQSPMLTAFLTIFNARLGYWIRNPNWKIHHPEVERWSAASPQLGGKLLWDELAGRTDAKGEFVHLSDGGHFDNMGVYELVRRRCRYIVAVDAGEDGDPSDENLATLIRLCRIDFGVRIQVDTEPLRMRGEDRLTAAHVAIGQIRYDDVDSGQQPGVLVYVKISLTGDEPADLAFP